MDFELLRCQMVDFQLIRRGIKNERVLQAFQKVPRHEFVPLELRKSAYDDCPLAIGSGQTISQPYMVAAMTELAVARSPRRVLEIGTGSGYQTAILAELVPEVVSIERLALLAASAQVTLKRLRYRNITVVVGDGSLGIPSNGPYDAIIVTAGAPQVPASLVDQLAEGGRLVVPVGSRLVQELTVLTKQEGKPTITMHGGCVFVPLVGSEGWQ